MKHITYPTKKSLTKAYKDGFVNKDMYNSISKILSGKNPETIVFSGMYLRNELTKTLTANLNEEQTDAFKVLLNYVLDSDVKDVRACLLNGSAGTGKTTTISKLLYAITILCPSMIINVNAPTHKAIKLLESKCTNVYNDRQISFATTHSSLGLRMVIESDGRVKFKGNPNTTTDYQLMVVDEVSMIEDELFKLILDSKTYKKTKIILLGDRKQLPPVNSKDSYIFTHAKDHNVINLELTQIVRQVADNPIVKLTKFIGDNIDKPTGFTLKQEITDKGDGVIIRKEEQLDNILNYWFNLPEYQSNKDLIKVLCWTNRMVNRCNNKIRKILFNNPTDPFVRGDRIMAREPLFFQGKQFADNSDEFTVESCDIVTLKKTVPISYETIELDFYDIRVEEVEEPIRIIHRNSKELYEQKLEDVKGYCIKQKDSKIWSKYYDMKQWTCDINYSYAGTIHTSQGSTYENAIVLEKDLEQNLNFVEKNKLRYTAFTRAKKKLIIVALALKKKYGKHSS